MNCPNIFFNFVNFVKKTFNYIFLLCQKKNKFIIVVSGIIIFVLCLIYGLKRDIYKKNNNYYWKNFQFDLKYNVSYIRFELDDIEEARVDYENRFIGIKSMFLGIIICVIWFSLKKGLTIGISLGTFLGSCLGIWMFIFFPYLIYSLELFIINLFKISF
ncbi:MAG: hypothetical protein BGWL_c3490 [Candidatus Phytoplasma cynodontis]|uniref:hypothetical protein n=1 Tax='Cynodon dactylon' phytoplasma TaxID=295320 RepID=UPI001265D340|nr:hypothetical protein ['Cynodon dactylon' phytoplasma]KAB8121841.1 hypothetical protein F1741_01135 ['Cynodon dactylon' phytoplasma]WIA07834.1 MAG: hypothetical protein BGWL_c3490 [Candidatus Phytoplasma cynodontis]